MILVKTEALKAAHQCSRISPSPVQGAWIPSGRDIRELEEALPKEFYRRAPAQLVFRRSRFHASDLHTLLATYFRQYAGLIIRGRKVIYLNAVRENSDYDKVAPGWRERYESICDGGPITFGVEFDPATKLFANFAFNGAI